MRVQATQGGVERGQEEGVLESAIVLWSVLGPVIVRTKGGSLCSLPGRPGEVS